MSEPLSLSLLLVDFLMLLPSKMPDTWFGQRTHANEDLESLSL